MTTIRNLYKKSDSWSQIGESKLVEIMIDNFVGFRSLQEHNFFELLLFLSGEGIIEIDGMPYPVSPGTFCFLTPFRLTQITVKGDLPLKHMVCKYDWSFIARERIYPIPQIEEMNYFLTINPYAHCELDDFALVLRTFELLYTEYVQQQDSLTPLFIRTHIMSLCGLHGNLSSKYNLPAEKASLLIHP